MTAQLNRRLTYSLMLLSVGSARGFASAASPVDDALDRWASTAADIESYDVTLVTSHESVSKATEKLGLAARYKCRHRFSSGMWRVDRLTEEYFGRAASRSPGAIPEAALWAVAWDGKAIRTCDTTNNIATLLQRSKLNYAATIGGPFYHELYLSSYMGEPYVRNIRNRNNAFLASGGDKIRIEAPSNEIAQSSWNLSRFVAELDPAHGYLPTCIAICGESAKDRDVLRIDTVYQYWPDDLWAPKSAVKSIQVMTGDKLETIANVRVDVVEARFNIPIDRAIFSFEFPVGTVVYEGQEKRNFLVSHDGGRDYEGYQRAALKKFKGTSAETPRAGRWPGCS